MFVACRSAYIREAFLFLFFFLLVIGTLTQPIEDIFQFARVGVAALCKNVIDIARMLDHRAAAIKENIRFIRQIISFLPRRRGRDR